MDNVNTEELSENTNENDWVLIKRITQQLKDTETVQLPEVQQDLANQIEPNIQMSNQTIEVIHEYIDSDNTSNDVSVITESDIDNSYQNFFTTRQDNKIYVGGSKDIANKINHQYDIQNNIIENNANILNKNSLLSSLDHSIHRSEDLINHIILLCKYNSKIWMSYTITLLLLGFIIGFSLAISLCIMLAIDTNLYKSGIKDLQTECHSIINILEEINATSSEIKAHILIENKLNKDAAWHLHAWQLLENINYSNKKNKFKEYFNNDPYILDNLQVSLNVLSILNNAIYDSNSLLKSETNKTLDIVNNTKILYETLISFNNTENIHVSAVQFLRNASNKIHRTSRSLLTDLVKKINNIMLNVYDKYNKLKNKFSEKLCYLKNMLPDDSEFLKQLSMKGEPLSNYYKYCDSKNISIKLNDKTSREQNARINDIKKQTKKTDNSMLNTKFERRDTQTIDIETCSDKVINSYSEPTNIVSHCTDETLDNSCEKTTDKQNIKATSNYGKITANKAKVNGPKPNNHFKSNGSTKKVSNTDKPIGKKNISPQIKMRNHVSKSDKGHYKPSFKNEPTEQNHHQKKSADWLFERSNEREKLRQASNMHFSKVKPSKSEIEIDANIRDMMRKLEQSIDKTMRFFKQKMEQIFKKEIV